ncbi:hypothetical protein J2741_000920 [Methanolinea mesophila]|uniref:hypothetical protein n=1 Tax=Methanolinea mesophila TaxID=547055 RepID=UPI001AE9C5A2|nr:hypothetical protein [Methanolinea mesophila]MBP1928373.1 hypothetical protein [Methanolinea mesophila]
MTIHTILGCCEQCGSWTKIYVLMCRENGSEERPRYYCGDCLGKGGEVPDSPFLDISTSGDEFRPGELPAA